MADEKYTRTFTIDAVRSEDNGKLTRIAISSEEPVMLKFKYGFERVYEVLGHSADEVDMSYFSNGAPLALNHNLDDQIGVLENVSLDPDGRLRADVKFSRSQRGQEIAQDVEDGIRTRISVGYGVKDYVEAGEVDGVPIVRATRWIPFEASIVPVPADITVGVGKSLNIEEEINDMSKPTDKIRKKKEIEEEEEEVEETIEEETEEKEIEEDEEEEEDEKEIEEDEEEEEDEKKKIKQKSIPTIITRGDSKMERKEQAQLARIAQEYGRSADLPKWIEDGRSVGEVMEEILDNRSNAHRVSTPVMSTREENQFSVAGAIEALVSGERGNTSLADEMGRDVAKAHNIATRADSIYIPISEPLFRTAGPYLVGSGDGANITAFQYLSFEDALRNQTILGQLGVEIAEFADKVSLPVGAGATAAWVAENGAVTATTGSITNITWSPNALTLDVPFTRQLKTLDGTYSVENIVRNDILGALLEGAEQGVFTGNGSGQPLGLLTDTNITRIVSSSTATYDEFLAMAVSQSVAKGSQQNLFYVIPAALYAKAQTTPQLTKTWKAGYLASGSEDKEYDAYSIGGPAILHEGEIGGVPVLKSNFITSNANGKQVVYGNFQKVLVAHFGVLEIRYNPYLLAANRRDILEGTLFMDSKARQKKDLVVHRGMDHG